MSNLLDVAFEVWTPSNFAVAVLAGAGVGLLLGRVMAPNPVYVSYPPWRTALIGFSAVAFIGSVFYIGQIVEAFLSGAQWDRILSRFLLWLLYALALGISASLSQRRRQAPQ